MAQHARGKNFARDLFVFAYHTATANAISRDNVTRQLIHTSFSLKHLATGTCQAESGWEGEKEGREKNRFITSTM